MPVETAHIKTNEKTWYDLPLQEDIESKYLVHSFGIEFTSRFRLGIPDMTLPGNELSYSSDSDSSIDNMHILMRYRSSPEDSKGSSPEDSKGSSPEDSKGSSPEDPKGSSPEDSKGSSPEDPKGSSTELVLLNTRSDDHVLIGFTVESYDSSDRLIDTYTSVVQEKSKAKKEYNKALSNGQSAALSQSNNKTGQEIFSVGLQGDEQYVIVTEKLILPYSNRIEYITMNTLTRNCYKNGVTVSKKDETDISTVTKMIKELYSSVIPGHIVTIQFNSDEFDVSTFTSGFEMTENNEFHQLTGRVPCGNPVVFDIDKINDVPITIESETLSDTSSVQLATLNFSTNMKQADCTVVFLIDNSGSMNGSRLNAAKSATKIGLRSLLPGSRFAIQVFNSNVVSYNPSIMTEYDHNRRYTQMFTIDHSSKSIDAACVFIDSIYATGGTEMNRAITSAFMGKGSTSVIMLTDAAVYNVDSLNEQIREHCTCSTGTNYVRPNNLHVIGICDSNVNACRSMARTGNGSAGFVNNNNLEKLTSIINEMVQKACRDTIYNIEIRPVIDTTQSLDVNRPIGTNATVLNQVTDQATDQATDTNQLIYNQKINLKSGKQMDSILDLPFAPMHVGSVTDGSITVAMLIGPDEPEPKEWSVSAMTPDGPFTATFPVPSDMVNIVDTPGVLSKIAASLIIKDISNTEGYMYSNDKKLSKREIDDRLLELSLKYEVDSPMVSRVAIGNKNGDVPTNLISHIQPTARSTTHFTGRSTWVDSDSDSGDDMGFCLFDSGSSVKRRTPMKSKSVDKSMFDTLLDQYDPATNLFDNSLKKTLGIDDVEMPDWIKEQHWITFIVLAYLVTKLSDERNKWNAIYDNVCAFLQKEYPNTLYSKSAFNKELQKIPIH